MNLIQALAARGLTLRHFNPNEFACKCGCGQNEFSADTAVRFDNVRHEYGKPLTVSSGYRCPKHNAEESDTGLTGPHTTGHAVDSPVDRKDAFRLNAIAIKYGFMGIGYKQHGTSRYMHLDDLPDSPGQPRPTIWSYP